jgi:nicotinamide-nucleotide amidase
MNGRAAEIVSVGSELLQGALEDTNGRFLAEVLQGIGIEVAHRSMVGDDRPRIQRVLRQALDRVSVVIVTGGLGPTADDCTREALADVSGRSLVLHVETLQRIEARFARRGTPVPESAKRQAWVPEGFRVLPNAQGTAPGLLWADAERLVVALPGPPREMRPLFTELVLPILLETPGTARRIRTRTIRVCGLFESQVEERVRDLFHADTPRIGLLARPGEVHVRVTAFGAEEEVRVQLARWEQMVRERLGDAVFAVDEERLEEVVGRLLRLRGQTMAVAESSTGGLMAHRITNVSGSSAYFERGVVAYSDLAKEEILGVPAALIARHGAVSPEVACAMAAGVRRVARADLGIGITGIAGPGGGSAMKPVGLIYIALAHAQGEEWCEHRFFFGREENKLWGSQMALEMLRRHLLKIGERV